MLVTIRELAEEHGESIGIIKELFRRVGIKSSEMAMVRDARGTGHETGLYDKDEAVKAILALRARRAERVEAAKAERERTGTASVQVRMPLAVYTRAEAAADEMGLTLVAFIRASIVAMLNREGF